LFKQLLQVRTAPAAPRAGAKALAQLTHAARPFDAEKIQYFALRDVKAETHFVIELHRRTAQQVKIGPEVWVFATPPALLA
jgi:hypothetical protein